MAERGRAIASEQLDAVAQERAKRQAEFVTQMRQQREQTLMALLPP
eukprot:SAG31_NODE_40296_length_281_cov_1.401099_1_plen_45_part_10